jgi:hypothetical protein
MTAENRLDTLLGALRDAEPRLDDLRRARVGAGIQAALREPAAPVAHAPLVTRARVLVVCGGLGLAAAAAAVAVIATGASRSSRAPESAERSSTAAPGPATSTARSMTPGAAIDVVPGATEHVAIGGADITVYGPARITSPGITSPGPGHPRAHGAADASDTQPIVIDADAVLVDRSRGDGAFAVQYGDLEVRATRATFAMDRTVAPRVTVMRGELLLLCTSGERTVRAGESGTCAEPAEAATSSSPPTPRAVAPTVDVPRPSTRTTPAEHDMYAEADDAMRRGDRAAARTALEAVVAAHPDAPESAAALLDLARLYAPFDADIARQHLDTLDAHPHGASLAEPSTHLRCTLVADDDHAARIACLADYYRRFPDSPRAAAVLARLAALRATTDCAAAAPLLDEYLRRFPAGADRSAVTAWRDRCAAP